MSVNFGTSAKRELLADFSVPRSTYLCTSHCGTQIQLRISSFFRGSGNFEGIVSNRSLKISVFLGLFAVFSLGNLDFAFAATDLPNPADIGLPFQGGWSAASSIGKIIKQAIMFSGILAIMALTYAGILMMLSYGDESKVKWAKSIIQYALIGVVLSGAAYAIIDAINALKLF